MDKTSAVFPSIRARMGDWWYYVTTFTLSEVNDRIKQVDDIHERQELKTWIQRELTPERLEQIADYLLTQKQHFFNAIVVGIYGGEPDWLPIKLGKSVTSPSIQLDERIQTSFGLLHLRGDEEIFAIDGQHRVEGIKKAVTKRGTLGPEEQCIIFVAHKATENGRERTRRLFTTLNKYARPVSKAELIALSEDDSFAIVTRRMIDEYPPLNGVFVPLTKTANIPRNDKKCVTTVIALYDIIREIFLPAGSRDRRKLEVGPPDKEKVQEIFDAAREYWDALRAHIRAIKEVTDSKPNEELASRYRRLDGGHVLFRPVGMKAFTKATRIMLNRGIGLREAVRLLSRTSLDLNDPPWPGVLWNLLARRMINRNIRLAQNLFLFMVRQKTEPESFDLISEYRKALDDPSASLDGLIHG